MLSCQKPAVLWILVTPNEIVGLYFRDYPLNDQPPFLSSLSLLRTRIFLAKALNMVPGSSYLDLG